VVSWCIVGLYYRVILPIPFWYAYFEGGIIGSIISVFYVSLKLIDMENKLKGTVEAIGLIVSKQLVSNKS
jgi:hypothetical protein